MFIHIKGSSETVVTEVSEDMVQPNAIDVKINRVYQLLSAAAIPKEGKTAPADVKEIACDDSFFYLHPGVYSFDAAHEVEMAEGEVGFLIPRSSLTRNGVDIRSGLYDSGYKGGINGLLVVHNSINIEKGARVAQFVICKAEAVAQYNGQYQKKEEQKKDSK